MDDQATPIEITDKDILVLKREEEDALEYRERKHDDWTENYTLYRDKVITNRLTQRQTVNIPLMRYVLNTLLKEQMDPPQLYFGSLSNNQQKEIYYNEYWKETMRLNKLVIKDHVDKKQNGLFGRAFKKLNIVDGKVKISLVDPQCMLVHRLVDPTDLDSAPTLIETDIFVTLNAILENEDYDKKAKKDIQIYFTEESGQLESDDNFERASKKTDRLKNIGLDDVDDPVLGETYVELHEAYRFEWDEKKEQRVIMKYVLAVTKVGMFKLHKKELCEVIGETADNFWYSHFPYSSWASDPEATDFWSDGVADIIRQINKVLNVWFSQLVENRTLQNFGMKYYDSTNPKFVPQTFSPQPWAHFPTPGDPNKMIKDVMTGNLTGTLEEMTFLIQIAEKSTAATNTSTGETTKNVTLGDLKMALSNAQKRIMIQQVFYTEDWKDFGLKYLKFLEASGDKLDPLMTYRKGRLGKKMYKKELKVSDWKDDSGYMVEVLTVTNKQEEDVDALQKLNALKMEMPLNVPLLGIYRHKLMEFSGLSPDEISQVEEFEKQEGQSPMGNELVPANASVNQAQPGQPGAGGLPQVPDIVGQR